MANQLRAPAGATHFKLFRLIRREGINQKTGKEWKNWCATKLLAPPDAEGRAVDAFPISVFDLAQIAQAFGFGRYRIEWHNADTGRKPLLTHEVELADPTAGASKGAPAPLSQPARPLEAPNPAAPPTDPLSLIAWADARADRQMATMREEFRNSQERDRQFMAAVVAGRPVAAAGAAGAGDAPATGDALRRELELVRRELALEQREALAKAREEIRAELEEEMGDDDNDDPSYVPPKNMKQAASRVGIRLIEELEQRAPGLLEAAIPAIFDNLKKAGFKPSRELEAAAGGRTKEEANGVNGVTREDFDAAINQAVRSQH